MTILIPIFLTLVLIAYMVITDRKVGTAYSISDSFYSWRKVGYSAAFMIFIACIAGGLILTVHYVPWEHTASPILLIIGAFTCFAIGIYANFKQGWRESMGHNIFSASTFALVLISFYVEGVRFPLESFALMSAVILPIDVPKKTTVIEVIGIALAIMGVYYLV
jgi:hypothetical protein